MRKLLFICALPLLSFTVKFATSQRANAQAIQSQVQFNTLADLKSQMGAPNVQVFLNGLTSVQDQNGGTYTWDPNSTATANDFTIVQVTGQTTGRWMRLGNSNTIKGSLTLSGAALTTAYTINYSSQLPFVPITVLVQPRSSNAAVPSWVSSITNTGFTVNFTSVPVLGTNNITIDYIVVKQ